MKINTRVFGNIEIAEDKIITFDNGIIGFPDMKKFTLLHDSEQPDDKVGVRFLQSIDEPAFAMPVMDPLIVKSDYKPMVDMDLLEGLGLGKIDENNILVVVTLVVPSDVTKMTVNLQGPIVINTDERKACQLVLDGMEYPVRYPIYDILKAGRGDE